MLSEEKVCLKWGFSQKFQQNWGISLHMYGPKNMTAANT